MRNFGLAIIAAIVVVIGLFKVIPKWQISKAQAFCESFIPRLEEHRLRAGIYPKQLADLLEPQNAPPKLAKANGGQVCGYIAAGADASSRFSMFLPAADRFLCMYCSYQLNSETKQWRFHAD